MLIKLVEIGSVENVGEMSTFIDSWMNYHKFFWRALEQFKELKVHILWRRNPACKSITCRNTISSR